MKKTIYINGYCLTQTLGGVQRFAINILRELDNLLDSQLIDYEFVCIVPNHVNVSYQNIIIKIVKPLINSQTFFEQITLPIFVKSNFLICLCNFAPVFKSNQLVVVHDIIQYVFPENQSRIKLLLLKKILTGKSQLTTVSKFSQAEIQKVIGGAHKSINVIYNSVENFLNINSDLSIIKKMQLKSYSYIMGLSSQAHMKHKNIDIMFELSKYSALPIVFVGSGTLSNVIFTNRICDAQIKSLYQNAFCFIFPSLYEGFGIPPLEAMICGCPVVVSDIPVMHEVCGDAALYFDPHDVNSLHDAINQLKDHDLRNELISKGYERIKLFSWKQSATKLFELILAANDKK